MNENHIRKALQPMQNRIHINRVIECLQYGFIAGSATIFLMEAIACLFPLMYQEKLAMLIMGVWLAVALVVSLLLRPSVQQAASIVDSLGLQERVITSLELEGRNDPISKIQRFDAYKQLLSLDVKKSYPIKADIKKLGIGFGILAAAALIALIPTQAREEALRQERVMEAIQKQAELFEKEKEEIKSNPHLSSRQKAELESELNKLREELKKARSEAEAFHALLKARNELSKAENEIRQLKALGEKLMENPLTKGLGKQLARGDIDRIKSEVEQVNELIKNMTAAERAAFAQFINEAAKIIQNDPSFAAGLEELARAVQNGPLSEIAEQLSEFGSTLANMAAQDQALMQAMNNLAQAIENSSRQIAGASGRQGNFAGGSNSSGQWSGSQSSGSPGEWSSSGQWGYGQSGQAGQSGSSGQSGTSNQNGQGWQSGSGSGTGSQGSNSDSQSGQGQGTGQGAGRQGAGGQGSQGQGSTGGGGAGSGTSNADTPYSDSTGQSGSRQGPSGKQVKEYEKIYDPVHLGGSSQESTVSGVMGEGGESQFREIEQSIGVQGEAVPYNQVFGKYKSEAMESIQEGEVPPSMRQIVEEYFTSLE